MIMLLLLRRRPIGIGYPVVSVVVCRCGDGGRRTVEFDWLAGLGIEERFRGRRTQG